MGLTYTLADLELFKFFFLVLTVKAACLTMLVFAALKRYVEARPVLDLLKSIWYLTLMTTMFFCLALLYEPPWN